MSPLPPTQLGFDLRLTLVRAGATIEMAVKGDSLCSVMDHTLWKRPGTTKLCLKVWHVMGASVADQSRLPSRAAGSGGALSAAQYSRVCDLTRFFRRV
jgi:hypothetical protein